MTTQRLLYEILNDLSSEELRHFNLNIELEKGVPLLSKHHSKEPNAEEVVELMVEKYSEESVKLTKNVLKKMNRTDLVQRLSDSSAESEEEQSVQTEAKQWPSLIQRVETIASDIEVLMDILADLNEEELEFFRDDLKHTPINKPWWQLEWIDTNKIFIGDHQETVFLVIMTCGQHPVETTRKILKKMKRRYLLQRLSNTSSWLKKKESDEQHSALIQKVATMAAVQQLLVETLHCLNEVELHEFEELLNEIVSKKDLKTISYQWRDRGQRAEIVDLMIRKYGQQSVELTTEVLEKMNRTDLIQMLSESSSALREKHSVDKHQPPPLEKAVKEDDELILFQTLKGLSFKELEKFRFLLQFTYVQKSLPQSHWIQTEPAYQLEELVDLIVENQQPVEVTKEVLMDMNRSDLVERLSGTSSGLKGQSKDVDAQTEDSLSPSSVTAPVPPSLHSERKFISDADLFAPDKSPLDWLQTVETVTSVTELLMETLADLSEEELQTFTTDLKHTWGLRNTSNNPWLKLEGRDHQETVFKIIMSCGKHSVEITTESLKQMRRADLVERLSDTSSILQKKESDEQHSALIQKVATMAAVQQLLVETLHCLNKGELHEFTELLNEIVSKKGPRTISHLWRDRGQRAEIVDEMMRRFGQQSVELTRTVLEKMNRADLTQALSESSSALREKHSVDKHQPTPLEKAVNKNAERILFRMLGGLSFKELEKFRFLLQFTYFQKSLPQIPWFQTDPAYQLQKLVYHMVKNQQPVNVTKEVLMDMNRSGRQGQSQPDRLQKEPPPLSWTVFETLRGLSSGEFEQFKDLMQRTALQKGLQASDHQISETDGFEMVRMMVKIYNQRSIEVMADVLRKMGRTDLAWKLKEIRSQLKAQEKSKRLQKESSMTADHEQLLEILEKLSPGELEKFRHVLQYSKLRGFPKIPGSSMETAETVRLMVENYGQQSVEVAKDVLERIKGMDLVEKLSESSSGSHGPSGSLEPEVCGRSTSHSTYWTTLEPGVNSSAGDKSPTYSLKCETGNYECSVSGLRWVCKEEVSFQYHFCSWGGHMERIKSIMYVPAGPLIDIKVVTGRLNEVYLPHWICTEDDTKISDNFAVLHMEDCGDVVEKVSEVTPSHVKLTEPVFSPRAVLIKAGLPLKTRCNMLLYKSNTASLTLHVYLIPCDPCLQQETEKRELSYGYKPIRKPHPEKSLKMRDRFILTADVDEAEIYPEVRFEQDIKLRYEWGSPNFFEVFIENPDGNIILKLTHKTEGTPVWTCALRRVEYQTTGQTHDSNVVSCVPQEEHFVDIHYCDLVNRVSNIRPILDMLRQEGVIRPEEYDEIRDTPTNQEKMRELFRGPLTAGGQKAKDAFYRILELEESYLVHDLKRKTS